ncbi:MAG TPA: DUF2252 domain-containing protein [Amycolatopsis sp.]|nr:DUF2252 domain-containing protein [Amycolatopsis sp.]
MATTTKPAAVEDTTATTAERAASGKAARSLVPRSSHAEFARDPRQPDPLALLARQDTTRVTDLLPIRYGRMAVSPLTYFRGAALPMAADLAGTPRTGLFVQACGDAHLMNFGLFASPERRLIFDINDFDETHRGPWEWDVKRLAASLEITGRENGFAARQLRMVVTGAIEEYRRAMREFAGQPVLDIWYARADVETVEATFADQLSRSRRRRLTGTVDKARTKTNLGALRRFTTMTDGRLRIVSTPPLIVQADELIEEGQDPAALKALLRRLLHEYRNTLEPERRVLLDQYRFVDLARKVVGVGSVGTRCWMVLMLGKDDGDPLFLQAKEAGPSVWEEFTGASRYGNAGRRVVVGQRLMQTVSDIFLGWVRAAAPDGHTRDFYLRQLRDWKGSADIESMSPPMLLDYGRICGWTLARAHARTGDDIAIAAYLGSGPAFDEAVSEFARHYADQNERDHAALTEAIRTGRVTAESGR